MPKFGVRVPHTTCRRKKPARGWSDLPKMLQEKFQDKVSDLQQSWEGDTLRFRFKTYGIPLEGGITVTDNELNLAGDLPFSAMMFRGKIESAIREQLERLVAA